MLKIAAFVVWEDNKCSDTLLKILPVAKKMAANLHLSCQKTSQHLAVMVFSDSLANIQPLLSETGRSSYTDAITAMSFHLRDTCAFAETYNTNISSWRPGWKERAMVRVKGKQNEVMDVRAGSFLEKQVCLRSNSRITR